MAPSTVFLGLTLGASLCLPHSIPAKRAKVSDPKEMARGRNTRAGPRFPSSRRRSRQESIRGNTSPAKTAQVTAAKGMPFSSSYRWMARAKITKTNTAPSRAVKGSTGRAVSAALAMDSSRYTHPGTRAAAATVRGMRGFPFSPAAACISSQAPMAHIPAVSTMVAQDGAQPRIRIRSGRPTTATITRLNIVSTLLLFSVKAYFFTPPNRRSRW